MAVIDLTTRSGWGSDRGRAGYFLPRVDKVVIHHWYIPDIPATATRAKERQAMRGVEDYHANLGWSAAPGYQYCVMDSGRAYEGVGYGRRGVHVVGQNSSAVGLAFANNGDREQPTTAAWRTMALLVELGVKTGHIAPDYKLYGHRDFANKSCPGDKTYPHLGRIRSIEELEDDVVTEGDTGPNAEKAQRSIFHGFATFPELGDSARERAGVKGKSIGEYADGLFFELSKTGAQILQRRILRHPDNGEWSGDDAGKLWGLIGVKRSRILDEAQDDATLEELSDAVSDVSE